MSIDSANPNPLTTDDASFEWDTFPEPVVHGGGIMNNFADVDSDSENNKLGRRGTLYESILRYWEDNAEDSTDGSLIAIEDFQADWLPKGDFALLLQRSGWKAGLMEEDSYHQLPEFKIVLRRWDSTSDPPELRKPALSVNIEIFPQFDELVYKNGNEFKCPYGPGTRIFCWTTWADTPFEIEGRAYEIIRQLVGADALDLDERINDSRRIPRAEAHIRFHRRKKNALIEVLDQSKQLVARGHRAEIDVRQKHVKEGWEKAKVKCDRWHILGFPEQRFSTELKMYHTEDWTARPLTDPFAHPKFEASYFGVNEGKLPHVDEWDDILTYLKTITATHAHWAGIDRGDLIADDFFAGPEAPPWEYKRPSGRREMLREYYQELGTEIYREALKEQTYAPYDILSVIAQESGATYDLLQRRTGLAKSTVRHHVGRLAKIGVVLRIGNPVVVVFVSSALHDRAKEILRKVRPEDTVQDMDARVDERCERRNQGSSEASDGESGANNDDSESSNNDLGFRYLEEISGDFDEIEDQYREKNLGDRDVRLRADKLPEELR